MTDETEPPPQDLREIPIGQRTPQQHAGAMALQLDKIESLLFDGKDELLDADTQRPLYPIVPVLGLLRDAKSACRAIENEQVNTGVTRISDRLVQAIDLLEKAKMTGSKTDRVPISSEVSEEILSLLGIASYHGVAVDSCHLGKRFQDRIKQ